MHFHGTPITPRGKLLELAGRCFCVRYGEHRDVEPCHEIGQAVMLDNGAFPAFTKGTPTDWPGFYRWCERWLEHWTTWAVIPDVIDGDEATQDALIAEWPFGDRGAPVWHMHESLDRLVRLCEEWPLVCIGSSGDYWKIGSPSWTRRMAETMDTATDENGVPLTRLHMLRGLRFAGGPYPFYSADSTDIARNHAGSHRAPPQSPRLMADRIDCRQAPARWHHVPAPMELEYGLRA